MKKSLPILLSVSILLIIFIVIGFVKNRAGHSSGGEGGYQSAQNSDGGRNAGEGSEVAGSGLIEQGDGIADSKNGISGSHSENSNEVQKGESSQNGENENSENENSAVAVAPQGSAANSVSGNSVNGASVGASSIGSLTSAPSAALKAGQAGAGGTTTDSTVAALGAGKGSNGLSGTTGIAVPNGAGAATAGLSANGVAAAQVGGPVVTKIPVQPNIPACARVTFQNQEKDLKVKRHELTLSQKVVTKKDLCVTVNGEGVVFDLQQGSKIVFDYRMKGKGGDVVATYCLSGACKISCPKPKADFFDAMSAESSDDVIKGFAGDESAEEKHLQKELASLQKLLKEPNAKRKVVSWSESARNEGPCSQIVHAGL